MSTQFPTEFHRMYAKFPEDLEPLVKNYPLIAVISTVVFSTLAMWNAFSFSVTGWLTAPILAGLAISIGSAILKKGLVEVGPKFIASMQQILVYYSQKKA